MFTTIALLEASTALEDRVSHLYEGILKLNPKFTKTDYIPLPLVGVLNSNADLEWVAGSPEVHVATPLDEEIKKQALEVNIDFKRISSVFSDIPNLLEIYETIGYNDEARNTSEVSPFINDPLNANTFVFHHPTATPNHITNAEKFPTGDGLSAKPDINVIPLGTSYTITTQLPDLKKLTADQLKIVFDNLLSEPMSPVSPTPNLMRAAQYVNSDGYTVYEFTPLVEPEIDFTQVGASYRASEADHDAENDAQRLDRELAESDMSDLEQDDGGLDSGDHHNMHDD